MDRSDILYHRRKIAETEVEINQIMEKMKEILSIETYMAEEVYFDCAQEVQRKTVRRFKIGDFLFNRTEDHGNYITTYTIWYCRKKVFKTYYSIKGLKEGPITVKRFYNRGEWYKKFQNIDEVIKKEKMITQKVKELFKAKLKNNKKVIQELQKEYRRLNLFSGL